MQKTNGIIKTCVNCQKPFEQLHKPGPIQNYCSRTCSREYDNKRHRERPKASLKDKTCSFCGTPFLTKLKKQIYCSFECRKQSESLKKKVEPKILRCNWCQKTYSPKANASRYCSRSCKEKRIRSTEKYKELNRIQCRKKRANRRNTFWEYSETEWQETLTYFDNKCAYCGKDNVPLTQDHIIPVTRNGSTEIKNIVPACRNCNSQKCNRSLHVFLTKKYDVSTAAQINSEIAFWYHTASAVIHQRITNNR